MDEAAVVNEHTEDCALEPARLGVQATDTDFFCRVYALDCPELDKLLDHSRTRMNMQELFVDIFGKESVCRIMSIFLSPAGATMCQPNCNLVVRRHPNQLHYKTTPFRY